MLFFNKNKVAISKITPVFGTWKALFEDYTERFENEIAPLKIHFAFSFFLNVCFFVQIEEFEFSEYELSKALFRFRIFADKEP